MGDGPGRLRLHAGPERRWETSVARVVWLTFLGDVPKWVGYKDGDPKNRRPNNLFDDTRTPQVPPRQPFDKFHPTTHPHLQGRRQAD